MNKTTPAAWRPPSDRGRQPCGAKLGQHGAPAKFGDFKRAEEARALRMATQAWWPLVLAAQQRRMGGGMMPDRPAHLQAEPDWLMSRVEEYWVGPCSAKLPEIMHGTPCM